MKKILIFLLVFYSLGMNLLYAQVNLSSGLVAKYYFNGNANDESGNANNGVVHGASLVADRFGVPNHAYSFNGSNAYILAPTTNFPVGSASISYSLWVNPNHNGYDKRILEYGSYDPGKNFNFYISDDIFRIDYWGGQYYNFATTSQGQWQHIVVLNNGTKHKFFLNGILQDSGYKALNIGTAAQLYIGRCVDTGYNYSGMLDDIRIYNRELNAQEVWALYNETNIEPAAVMVPDTIFHIGHLIEIPVINTSILSSSSNIISYQFDLAYDSTKIKYLNCDLAGTIAWGGVVNVNAATSGLLHVSYMSTVPLVGSGPILKLRFTTLDMGTSPLVFTDFLYNTLNVTNISDGSVHIFGQYGDVDINDYVQAYDAALCLQYSSGMDPLPLSDPLPWESWRILLGNVDTLNQITAFDASLILQYSCGLISSFPADGAKSSENPVADIYITQNNSELVFSSTGELYGLNIFSNHGTNVILNQPVYALPGILTASNISSNTYNIALCTTTAPADSTVIVRVPFSCTGNEVLSFTVVVNTLQHIISVPVYCTTQINENNSSDMQIHVFPNPVSNEISIQKNTSLSEDVYLSIKTIDGKIVWSTKTKFADQQTLTLPYMSDGLYLVSLQSENYTMTKKIIIQH